MTEERLNKYLAFHLGVSRREADLLIEKGSVIINASIAELGARVKPGDAVSVNGTPVAEKKGYTTLLFINLLAMSLHASSRVTHLRCTIYFQKNTTHLSLWDG